MVIYLQPYQVKVSKDGKFLYYTPGNTSVDRRTKEKKKTLQSPNKTTFQIELFFASFTSSK